MSEAGSGRWTRILAAVALVLVVLGLGGYWGLSRADGPVWVFAGGPFRSGEIVAFEDLDWGVLDARHELELEIVGAESSRILWFNAVEGAVYVGCDLDCIGGRLTRWPQQIERDDRVVIRIDGKRVVGRLVHVPHATEEYVAVHVARARKYAGDSGGRAAAETAAHGAIVEWGEVLTGRTENEEPGDRLYRFEPEVS